MASKEELEQWKGRMYAFRQRLWHLQGPINDLEKAELQSQFDELMRLTCKVGGLEAEEPPSAYARLIRLVNRSE